MLSRENAPAVLNELLDGDLVAFVRERPGLLVHHAGLVYWANGTPRLLHASSYHGRVVITVRRCDGLSAQTIRTARRHRRPPNCSTRPLIFEYVPIHNVGFASLNAD